jgi:hypothetical protein
VHGVKREQHDESQCDCTCSHCTRAYRLLQLTDHGLVEVECERVTITVTCGKSKADAVVSAILSVDEFADTTQDRTPAQPAFQVNT